MTGLPADTSGVALAYPKVRGTDGSTCEKLLLTPYGFAKFGWLNMLNISARNCSERRSPRLIFLVNDRSTSWSPGPLNILRAMLPHVPGAGGVMTEFPLT